jgi:hypothetical protein
MSKKAKKQQPKSLKQKAQDLLSSAKSKLSACSSKVSLKRVLLGAVVVGGALYASHQQAAVSFKDGQASGCSQLASKTLNPMLQPRCIIGKSGQLLIEITHPLTQEKIFFSVETGLKVENN